MHLFPRSYIFNGSGLWIPGQNVFKFSMRFLNILDYLETDPPAENSVISYIIQETCSDR